ncbi:hypothetical protein [Sneathiella limimaris]|uniref:hypothetical protein n=1 Tax=Sneathiella limimaris TaxID=1964213 RepID=UPI00146C351F|nr:hypothetical protein [Sneathiella limimaris]
MSSENSNQSWLEKPNMKNRLYWGLVVVAILVALPDLLSLFHIVYEMHPYTEIEKIPAFYGLYGLIAFLTLIAVAKAVQKLVAAKEDYYD